MKRGIADMLEPDATELARGTAPRTWGGEDRSASNAEGFHDWQTGQATLPTPPVEAFDRAAIPAMTNAPAAPAMDPDRAAYERHIADLRANGNKPVKPIGNPVAGFKSQDVGAWKGALAKADPSLFQDAFGRGAPGAPSTATQLSGGKAAKGQEKPTQSYMDKLRAMLAQMTGGKGNG